MQAQENFEEDDNYNDVLHSLSKKWQCTQLTHKVSAKATNDLWSLAIGYFPKLFELKEREGRTKEVPKFIQQRRKMYQQYCPDVHMEFAFQKKSDGSIVKVYSQTAPLKTYQQNPNYVNLYEIAYIKVSTHFLNSIL